jgi:hypothetical protein
MRKVSHIVTGCAFSCEICEPLLLVRHLVLEIHIVCKSAARWERKRHLCTTVLTALNPVLHVFWIADDWGWGSEGSFWESGMIFKLVNHKFHIHESVFTLPEYLQREGCLAWRITPPHSLYRLCQQRHYQSRPEKWHILPTVRGVSSCLYRTVLHYTALHEK